MKENGNKEFWNELCGTKAFQKLGLKEVNKETLATFDNWYMEYYPYLYTYLTLEGLGNKKVLEIGLGFGTVGEKLFKNSKFYTGLDYSDGPIDLMNQRISWNNKETSAQAIQGDAKNLPFEDNTFDQVVSICCLHHTGDTKRSLEEVYRVLTLKGKALIMLYYKDYYTHNLIPLL